MARTTARNVAMQLLYEAEMGGVGGWLTVEGLIELPDGEQLSDDDRLFVDEVVKGVSCCKNELDGRIAPYLRGWTMDRLARLDLCIMRLAAYEMTRMAEKVPRGVSANEAVELANAYSTPESGSFINGVLGSLLRELERGE